MLASTGAALHGETVAVISSTAMSTAGLTRQSWRNDHSEFASSNERLALLEKSRLLDGLPEKERRKLLSICSEVRFDAAPG